MATPAVLGQKVRQDFGNACKKGLMYGRVSLPSYRDNNPLLVHVNYVAKKGTKKRGKGKSQDINTGMYHEYESHNDLLEALENGYPDIYIEFANNITFKVEFGSPYRSRELRSVFQNIFEDNYIVQGSSIQFDKTDKKLILNLSLSIPVMEHNLDENVIVGVDIGQAIPAMCSLNNNFYERKKIGNVNDFLTVRTKFQNMRRNLQRNLKNTSGGHGRNKKLKALNRYSEKEKNFVRTYNHMVSCNVVNFALKNNAKYIHMEYLKGFDKNKFVLRNWSYYQLQKQIEYKAKMQGIEVRYINPCFTSQVCSVCGEWKEDNRKDQEHFICGNPNCKSHKLYTNKKGRFYFNADFNASRNIAKSNLFITPEIEKIKSKDDLVKKLIENAKEYYQIN